MTCSDQWNIVEGKWWEFQALASKDFAAFSFGTLTLSGDKPREDRRTDLMP